MTHWCTTSEMRISPFGSRLASDGGGGPSTPTFRWWLIPRVTTRTGLSISCKAHYITAVYVDADVRCTHRIRTIKMKGTKVLTLGAGREVLPAVTKTYTLLAIRMRYMCIYACGVLLIGGRAGPFYRFTDSWSLTSLLRVGHRVAILLDSTRESILALRYNFWRLQGSRGKPVLICNWLFRLFSRHISRTQSFQ